MKRTINILHLSHTDIGYTDTQARIMKNQINFLKELVDQYDKNNEDHKSWRWICESFYVVEKFLKEATEEQTKTFLELVEAKIVSLSGSYLNIAELANKELYQAVVERTKKICDKHNFELTSAICNDVNGFAVGYGQALEDNGINNLYFGLHTHHGMFPTFKKQSPFYWEVSKGKKILVWVGEHYMTGNELGLVDVPFGNYTLQSTFENGYFDESKQLSESKKRVLKYIENLDAGGYKFKNIPISVLGANTDNAPFNLSIAKRVELLNKEFASEDIEFKMVTLEEFFENIRQENKDIPTYEGEWPDWWSDGVGSTPLGIRIFRQALRNYTLIKQRGYTGSLEDLEESLMLYSEHTWGKWSSIEDPYEFSTQEISATKQSYASNALFMSNNILDEMDDRKVYKLLNDTVINLELKNYNKSSLSTLIHINHYLSIKELANMDNGFKVKVNGKEVEPIIYHKKYMNIDQNQYYVVVSETKDVNNIEITLLNDPAVQMTYPTSMLGADRINDVYNPLNNDEVVVNNKTLENDFMILKWNDHKIYSLINKKNKEELINPEAEGLFTPIYEVCEIPYEFEQMNLQRRWTGRNRKMSNFKRHEGTIEKVRILNDKKDFTVIEFYFDVKGTKYYKLLLEVANDANEIKATIKICKDIEWSLENFYVSIPFNKKEDKILFEKGNMFEVWKDQLPGSLIDYYSIQEGMQIKKADGNDLLVSAMDSNLYWTGSLDYQRRFLAHDKRNKATPNLYAWIMNTAWETNFNADISGFHEFRFNIAFSKKGSNPIDDLKLMNGIYSLKRK